MKIKIDNANYEVFEKEFETTYIEKYCNLKIYPEIGFQERLIGLLNDLSEDLCLDSLLCVNSSHGGFIPLNSCCKKVSIFLEEKYKKHNFNITTNIDFNKKKNINIIPSVQLGKDSLIFVHNLAENMTLLTKEYLIQYNPVIVSVDNPIFEGYYDHIYFLNFSPYKIYIPNHLHTKFCENFNYYLHPVRKDILNYDNLINLCIMVKNGGEQFESMLQDNLNFIDRWTILDTGSTDKTIDIINKVLVGKKKGKLYQEPFINFRDSRNRLMDLAGNNCKYTLMLDDTYVVQGDLRKFLNTVRGDQYGDTFSLYILSHDSKYCSNRIVKTYTGLRYINTIHEVISDKNNKNVVIPEDDSIILDRRFDYMEERTNKRKQLDLELLYKELEEDPNNPRTYYYLAQTYNCIGDHENAYKYFLKRAEFRDSGFRQELVDALFEAGRTANFQLNKPWEECFKLYEDAYNVDRRRPDAPYFIGMHYYLENNYKIALKYFKQAFELGFPIHCQYSLKPTLSFHFLPKILAKLCYIRKDFDLGFRACELFLKNNPETADNYKEIVCWHGIYSLLNTYKGDRTPIIPEKRIFCFVAPGGFNKWNGRNIYTTGVGGAETFVIEMAKYIAETNYFSVYVFCNCENSEVVDNVFYRKLEEYPQFIMTTYVHTCVVSRYSQYLPLTYEGWSENVFLSYHDLSPEEEVIVDNKKLRNVIALSEWHAKYMATTFPTLNNKVTYFYYGIDFDKFKVENLQKVKNSFIYSSFANRGLLVLLEMWPKIYQRYPDATLDIFCDLDNKWVNDFHGQQIKLIKQIFQKYNVYNNGLGIKYHGWVDKKTLANAWKKAQYWFYPCIFMETFCLTALEAAMSKTLAITNDLAALQTTVGNRGIVITGNPLEEKWREEALNEIFKVMDKGGDNDLVNKNYEWASGLPWQKRAETFLEQYVLPNVLEYKNMFNWTNNVLDNDVQTFSEVIGYFNQNYKGKQPKILEIGTWTGTSLISLVKNIPNSIGIGVDCWKNSTNYSSDEKNFCFIEELGVQQSFNKNINIAGLKDRIIGIKSDSTKFLLLQIKLGEKFDFIYVDGGHTMLQTFSDLILAWNVLNKNGIFIIDDYLFQYEERDGLVEVDNTAIMNMPFEAVNTFLENYKGEYKILLKNYRIFLEKTV